MMTRKFQASYTSEIAENLVAEGLLKAGTVEFIPEKPIRLKSGLISPIYVDNRKLYSVPTAWSDTLELMISRINEEQVEFDVIAGVNGAASMQAAAMADRLDIPVVLIRKDLKTYGNHTRIEGGSVKGKRVLMVADHVSTGISASDAACVLRNAGATVRDLITITDFGINDTKFLFEESRITLHRVVSFAKLIEEAQALKLIDVNVAELVRDWLKSPEQWAQRHQISPVEKEN